MIEKFETWESVLMFISKTAVKAGYMWFKNHLAEKKKKARKS